MAFKRIERDSETNDYNGYIPKVGDVWCFHDGQRWPVTWTDACGLSVGPNATVVTIAPTFLPVRSLTTHIERPVRTVTVPKEGYVPRVGDRLCGPEGAVLTIKRSDNMAGHLVAEDAGNACCIHAFPGPRRVFEVLVLLCHHIERDEA